MNPELFARTLHVAPCTLNRAGVREARSPFAGQEGRLFFHHFDFVAQALAKIERWHHQDVEDVQTMVARGLVTAEAVSSMYDAIEARLYRYPALDAQAFRRAVDVATQRAR